MGNLRELVMSLCLLTPPLAAGPLDMPQVMEPGVVVVSAADLKVEQHSASHTYPILALMGHVKGTVHVRTLVGPDGLVLGAKALDGPKMLQRSAEEAIWGCTFKPGHIGWKAARVVTDLAVPFTLRDEPDDKPESPVTGFVLHVWTQTTGGAAPISAEFQEKEVAIRLEKLGLVRRDPASADPATTLDFTLALRISGAGGQTSTQEFGTRISSLADSLLDHNEAGKPARVWFSRRVSGQWGELEPKKVFLESLDQAMETLLPTTEYRSNLVLFLKDLDKPLFKIAEWAAPPPENPLKNVDFDFSSMKIRYQPPAPPYPPEAKAARIQGTVVVELTIDPTGKPIRASVIEGPPALQSTAIQYILGWRFAPAMLNGIPQTARFQMTMPFHLH